MNRRVLFISLLCLATAPPLRAAQERELQTRHYLIHTDLDSDLTADLAQRLDFMYDEYSQRLALFRTLDSIPKLEVHLFRSQRDYVAFTHGILQNSAGTFLAGRNQLAAFLGDQGRDQLRRTLQHEAFHQFAHIAIGSDLPVWLNEGLAQYFEEGLWNGDGFLLGEVPPRRVRQLQADLKSNRGIDFSALLRISNEQWAGRLSASRADGVTQYNQSWAMIHFLVMARNDRGDYLYRTRLLDLLRLLHDGRPGDQAYGLAFGQDLEGFRQKFIDYAKKLKPTSEATLIENQGVLADLLMDFDRIGHRFQDIAALRGFVSRGQYRLHYSRGELAWDTEPGMARYFASLSGKAYGPNDLYLSPRRGAPLPDVVCRCSSRLILRTRFHEADNHTLDHELLIEPVASHASVAE